MFYFDWLDRRRPEPPWRLRLVAFAGMVSTLPALAFELWARELFSFDSAWVQTLVEAFAITALPEEFAKLAVVGIFVWRHPAFDERLDGIVYAAHAGLGFALVENVGYLFASPDLEAYWSTFLSRAVLAVPGHAIWAGMMGYWAARHRFDEHGPGIWGGFALAVILHGAYDAALIAIPKVPDIVAAGLALVPVMVILGGFLLLRHWAREALDHDNRAEAWSDFLAGRHVD